MNTAVRSASFAAFVLSFVLLSLLLALTCLGFSFLFARFIHLELPQSPTLLLCQGSARTPAVILDPGHGGEDGGATGVNGVVEKDLNLSLSMQMAALFSVCGTETRTTRDTDTLLYTEHIKGTLKNQDLHNRLQAAKSEPTALFISLHMNTFPEGKYRGLQIYYSTGHPNSRQLAETLRIAVVAHLQPDNTRRCKPGDSIYLLSHLSSPGILIECGFLSNPEECALLSDPAYRTKLALTLVCAVNDHLQSTAPTLHHITK